MYDPSKSTKANRVAQQMQSRWSTFARLKQEYPTVDLKTRLKASGMMKATIRSQGAILER